MNKIWAEMKMFFPHCSCSCHCKKIRTRRQKRGWIASHCRPILNITSSSMEIKTLSVRVREAIIIWARYVSWFHVPLRWWVCGLLYTLCNMTSDKILTRGLKGKSEKKTTQNKKFPGRKKLWGKKVWQWDDYSFPYLCVHNVQLPTAYIPLPL